MIVTHLNMVIPVIMNIDNPVKLGFFCNVQFCVTFDTFRQGLSGIFLHLDVKKFPEKQNVVLLQLLAGFISQRLFFPIY